MRGRARQQSVICFPSTPGASSLPDSEIFVWFCLGLPLLVGDDDETPPDPYDTPPSKGLSGLNVPGESRRPDAYAKMASNSTTWSNSTLPSNSTVSGGGSSSNSSATGSSNATLVYLIPQHAGRSLRPDIIACTVITLLIASGFVGMRFYIRGWVNHVLSPSDWCILPALVSGDLCDTRQPPAD